MGGVRWGKMGGRRWAGVRSGKVLRWGGPSRHSALSPAALSSCVQEARHRRCRSWLCIICCPPSGSSTTGVCHGLPQRRRLAAPRHRHHRRPRLGQERGGERVEWTGRLEGSLPSERAPEFDQHGRTCLLLPTCLPSLPPTPHPPVPISLASFPHRPCCLSLCSSLQVKGSNSDWQPLSNSWGATWEMASAPQPPLSFKVGVGCGCNGAVGRRTWLVGCVCVGAVGMHRRLEDVPASKPLQAAQRCTAASSLAPLCHLELLAC